MTLECLVETRAEGEEMSAAGGKPRVNVGKPTYACGIGIICVLAPNSSVSCRLYTQDRNHGFRYNPNGSTGVTAMLLGLGILAALAFIAFTAVRDSHARR
jgi:hypothetical protein